MKSYNVYLSAPMLQNRIIQDATLDSEFGSFNTANLYNKRFTSDDIFVGDNYIFNYIHFAISKFAINTEVGKHVSQADYNCFIGNIDEVKTILYARFFGDIDPTMLQKIKDYLAPYYAVDPEWKAHADYKWPTDSNTTVYEKVVSFWKWISENMGY